MRVAMVVPGGMDSSGVHNVIPVLLWMLRRISSRCDTHVFAMRGQDDRPQHVLEGATIHNIHGRGGRTLPTVRRILAEHRRAAFDVIHAFWASGPGVAGAIVSRMTGVPMLLHVTGGDMAALPDIGYGGRRTAWSRSRVDFALRGASRITAPSSIVADPVRAAGHAVTRLPLGVDRTVWRVRPPRRRDASRPARLVHAASLNRVKDQPTLLRAMRRLVADRRCFQLDVAGGDTLNGAVQRIAAELDVADRIRFHGFLPQSEIVPLVGAADIMVLSSLHEADPVVTLEAAVSGVPTVGTAVGHIRDWAPGAAAAVPVRDDAALAAAIANMLDNEESRLAIAGEAQQRAVAEDADWSAYEIMKIYDTLNAGTR